jgi:hypothetical protein
VAFTADLGPRWGKAWMRWPHFPQFVAQVMRWIQRKSTVETFDARVEVQEGEGMVQTDVYDAAEQFVNHLHLDGKVLTPDRQTLPITFTQTAPGRYQGHFPMQGRGDYLLTLVGKHDDTSLGPKTVGLAVPYSPEYLGLDINYSLLRRLAERTGGEVLQPDAPEDAAELLFAPQGQARIALKGYWPWFVALALGLFVVDIALRQVLWPAAWTARRQRQPEEPTPATPSYTYAELEAVVQRRAEDQRRRSRALQQTRRAAASAGEQAQHVTVASVRHRQTNT